MAKKQASKNQDILNHVLVPKHEILTKEEEKEFLDKIRIKKEDLPRIRKEDPAIRHLNPKLGDIVRIERKSPTAGKSYFYRVVSNE